MSDETKHTQWHQIGCTIYTLNSHGVHRIFADFLPGETEEGSRTPHADVIAAATVAAAASDLLAALREAEWAGTSRNVLTNTDHRCCPSCGNLPNEGHAADCTLAAAIAKAEGKTQ